MADSAPAAAATESAPESVVVAFVAALRRAGLSIPVGSTVAYTEALGQLGVADRDAVYWAGRATLVVHPEDIPIYDQVFAAFWDHAGFHLVPRPSRATPITVLLDDADDAVADDAVAEPAGPTQTVRYSPTDTVRGLDLADCTAEELAEVHRLIDAMRINPDTHRSRRRRPRPHGGDRLDLSRTVRRSLRTGGETIRRAHTKPAERPRRLVLLVDISGSMEPYARSLLRLAHAFTSGGRQVEAFAFGTRLTRLTRALSTRDPDAAFIAASEVVSDWAGGTRLGEVLAEFNDQWGVRGMARGATAVILSDGWDRGEPALVEEQMQRLHRVAYQVVWVNPLKASPGYQPLARGMAAALPHVDRFIEGHSFAALENLAREIAA